MIQKCDCGKTGCDRYVIIPHTQSYTTTQLAELRNEINEFLDKEVIKDLLVK